MGFAPDFRTPRVPYTWQDREPLLELDFTVQEFERRLAAVQQAIEAQQVDALLVYGGAGAESNVRYLSGFPSWWGQTLVAVPRSGEPVLLTNAIFHGEPLHSNLQKTWIRDLRPLLNPQSTGTPRTVADLAADLLRAWGLGTARIGIADERQIPAVLERELRQRLADADFVEASRIVKRLRRIKSPAEIDVIRRLGHIASAGMDAGLAAVRPGASESDVAAAADAACIAAGAERMDYGVLTAAGPRSFMKNIWPRADKRIAPGELVVVDIGTKLAGYQSDMSRNIVAGAPTDDLRRLLEACLEAEAAGLACAGPGVPIGSVLEAMSAVIARHGFAEWDWTTSHGFGLDIVEDPYFFAGNPALLEPGMCFYIEPMIVPTQVGTICFEDMVLVTDHGCEELTTSRKRTW